MVRTTVFADEKLLARARKLARRRGMSFAELFRQALELYLEAPRSAASLPAIAGRFSSGVHDTSERVAELLWRNPHE